MCEATQATQSLPEVEDGEDEAPKEKVWGRLISLNPLYPNVELTGVEVVLGRQSCCNVRYNDNMNISGKHCRIFREPSVNNSVIAFIQDMSTNGTFVNGDKLGKGNRLLLSSGFEISLVLNKKKAQDKVAYIFQECAEDKPQEEGGPHKKYDIREALGAGNFAVVKLAINKATGGRFAIKIIDKKKYLNQAGSRKEALMDEVKILRSLNHINIIHIEEMFDTEKTLYLVLELIEGGDLHGDISREGHYTEEKARSVFGQIIDAICFLHNLGIAHRDLKPENILLKTGATQDVFDVKLSDFGLSRTIGEGSFMKTMCGTPQYLAPEILTGGGMDGYGKEVDLWSAGAILYVLLCGVPPFDDTRPISIFEQIKQGLVEFPDETWGKVSPSAKDLIKRLLTVDPSRRYTALQTKDHPWMKGESTIPPEMEQIATPPTPLPPTPSKPIPVPAKKPTADDEQYGSVINYNKTLDEREKEKNASTPPTTPTTTNSTHSTPSTVANSPASIQSSSSFITPASSPTSSDKGSSNSLKDSSGGGKVLQVQPSKLKNSQKLVSQESEKNLQTQFEKVGIDKRKRNEDDDEDTDEDESLKPLTKSGSSLKSKPPSPPATKKLKKSATAEITPMSDSDDDDPPPLKKAPSKSSSSDQLLGSKKDSKPTIKHQNSFNSKKSDDNSGDEDDDEASSGNGKGNGNGKNNKKKDNRPMCKYGASCYRKNPVHLQEYQHP